MITTAIAIAAGIAAIFTTATVADTGIGETVTTAGSIAKKLIVSEVGGNCGAD